MGSRAGLGDVERSGFAVITEPEVSATEGMDAVSLLHAKGNWQGGNNNWWEYYLLISMAKTLAS